MLREREREREAWHDTHIRDRKEVYKKEGGERDSDSLHTYNVHIVPKKIKK